jgi:hypothetical protein
MIPTPGQPLDVANNALLDPTVTIVACLAKGPIDVQDRAIVLADLVEADFPGYARIPIVPGLTDPIDEVEYFEFDPQPIEFITGAIVTPQVITHIYYLKLVSGANPELQSAVAFDEPIILSKPDTHLPFTVVINGFQTT